MKILITNTVALNGGDAAILYAVLHLLKLAFGTDTQFVIYDKNPEIAKKYYPELLFRPSLAYQPGQKWITLTDWRAQLKRQSFFAGTRLLQNNHAKLSRFFVSAQEQQELEDYCTADLIVSTGGTYLREIYPLQKRIFDFQVSLACKRPLILFTQSLGPFNQLAYRQALKPIFEQAALILLRDEQSLVNIQSLGVFNAQTHITADAAFALADPVALNSAAANTEIGQPLRVAISVRTWQHFKSINSAEGQSRYTDAVRALCIHLREKHQAQITFISTCQGINEYWIDDSEAAQEIVSGLPEKIQAAISVDREFHAPETFAQCMQQFDFIIATRMHAAILSLGQGTSVLPIAYEFKTQEMFATLGQAHWVQDIETIQADEFIATVEAFIRELPRTRRALALAVLNERNRALESAKLVRQAFIATQISNGHHKH